MKIILFLFILIIILWNANFFVPVGALYVGALQHKNLDIHPRSKSEARIIKILSSIMRAEFPTAYPSWLKYKGRQLELDGYNEKLNLAIEFSGPHHTHWYPRKQSYEEYFHIIAKDRAKQILCRENGVHLIVVDMTLPAHSWRNYLLSRLYDLDLGTRPVDYIYAQTAEPQRNEQLESELNLFMP